MPAKIIVSSYAKDLKEAIQSSISGKNIYIETSYNIVDAVSKFSTNYPNVLILDIDNGIQPTTYLNAILKKYKLLIIITGSNTLKAMDFLVYGIKDYAIRPKNFASRDGAEYLHALVGRIKTYLESEINSFKGGARHNTQTHNYTTHSRMAVKNYKTNYGSNKAEPIIAIASSTGGPEALNKILPLLPENMPPILVVQHMPEYFTEPFAKRLNNFCKVLVKEAESGEPVYPGTVYIAPGGYHMVLEKRMGQLYIGCKDGKRVNGVKPAADVLFDSVAYIMKENAIGVILTGMGSDGAKGLGIMKGFGAKSIGQDEATSIVYGMPKVAHKLGFIDEQLPLEKIAEKLISMTVKG